MDAYHDGIAPGPATPELANFAGADLLPLDPAATNVLVIPTSEKASDTPHAGGPMQNRTHTTIFRHEGADSKPLATLRAHLALLGGFVLEEAGDGSFVVSRWGRSRSLPDLEAVAAFAFQVGGHHG